jgi:hypothetical protein
MFKIKWRKLHDEEFHNFHSSLNVKRVIISKVRWMGYAVHVREMRNAVKILVRKL